MKYPERGKVDWQLRGARGLWEKWGMTEWGLLGSDENVLKLIVVMIEQL